MARILIVDDEPFNRELLLAYLEGSGHELVVAEDGERALALAGEQRPDLVVLDVMMPGLSGYQVTRRLKDDSSEFLPVVLVTALSDHESRLAGLRAGADEFLTKPVDRHELLLRVSNLLTLRSRTMALARHNVELMELQRFRDEMSAMIVHDLKNPMSVVQLNMDFLAGELRELGPDHVSALDDARAAGKRTMRLIANLLDLTRLETGRLEVRRTSVEVSGLLQGLVTQRASLAKARSITMTVVPAPAISVLADGDLVARVVENVLDNALRYTPPGGLIEAGASLVNGSGTAELRVGNTGPAIPAEARTRIFEKYGQAGAGTGRMNLGLGLYFCRLVAEAHGGRLWVEETPRLPTLFRMALPPADRPA